jgi:quercetin dioxygenase-like cupin family protein
MPYVLTVAGGKASSKSFHLDDVAARLRKGIPKHEPRLAKRPLATQSGVTEVLLVVRGHENPHTHPQRDLIFSVLEGGGYVQLSRKRIEAPAGTTVVIPKGVCHAYHNTSPGDSVLLATFSPAVPDPSIPDPGECT